jgi:hypothetical protein
MGRTLQMNACLCRDQCEIVGAQRDYLSCGQSTPQQRILSATLSLVVIVISSRSVCRPTLPCAPISPISSALFSSPGPKSTTVCSQPITALSIWSTSALKLSDVVRIAAIKETLDPVVLFCKHRSFFGPRLCPSSGVQDPTIELSILHNNLFITCENGSSCC